MKKIFFICLTLIIGINVNAQLSNKHWIPPLHANEDSFNLQVLDHYIYLSTPEPTPFQVTVTTGSGVQITGSPFTISQGNPVRIKVGDVQPSNMMVSIQDVGQVIGGKGLILEGQYDFFVNFRVRAQNHAEFLTSKGRTGLGKTFRLGSLPQIAFGNIRNFVQVLWQLKTILLLFCLIMIQILRLLLMVQTTLVQQPKPLF